MLKKQNNKITGTISICILNKVLSTQPETRKLQQICCRLAATCCHQADIRMRSHRLLRLDDNKSAASCQQA